MNETNESREITPWSFDPERIRMAARSGWVTLSSDDALDLADEIERLRAEVAELRRTHPRLATARVRVSPSPFEEDYWT